MRNPFRYFNSSPEVIRLAVMMYIRYPLSLRQVEDLLFERGLDICHETVRYWWNRHCQSKILNTWSGHRTAQIDPEKCRKINGREIRF
jgi:transposase-like protein